MKTAPVIPLGLGVLALVALPMRGSSQVTYTDVGAPGDFTGGVGSLNISTVVVNNDANNLYVTVNLLGDPTTTSWANYLVGISEDLYGGAGGNFANSSYGAPIQMSVGGLDYVVAGYPDHGSGQLFSWSASSWSSTGAPTSSETSSSVTLTASLASLGLSGGSTFTFDVWSQSSGNSVLAALSDGVGVTRSWNNTPFDTGANALSYTVTNVPEPTSLTLLGLGSLLLIVRRKISV